MERIHEGFVRAGDALRHPLGARHHPVLVYCRSGRRSAEFLG